MGSWDRKENVVEDRELCDTVIAPMTLLGTEDMAAAWTVPVSNPHIRWVTGSIIQADQPNSNKQFFSAEDVKFGLASFNLAPVNLLHRFTEPCGVIAQSRLVSDGGHDKVEILGGVWAHLFPDRMALVEQASEMGKLFWSMECRGSHVKCAGPEGCGKQFEYADRAGQCDHLVKGASWRHIVNPVFRGAGIIVPPVLPGWKEAYAKVAGPLDLLSQEKEFASVQDFEAATWEAAMAKVMENGR